jgi:prepilin-type N-terminal cleavage/methylation domain-containing protein
MGTLTRRAGGANRRVTRAFSLVELALVIAIIGVLSAVAIPRLGNSIALYSVEGAARRIAADLKLARRHAMMTSTSQTFRTEGTGYSLIGMSHLDHPNQEYRVNLDQDCHGAAWVSVDVGGDQDLVFNMYGVPDSAAKLIIRVGDYKRTITVAGETGRVDILE